MNPSKSLMAFVFAVLLAIPALAGGPRVKITIAGQDYFAEVADRDNFTKAQDPSDSLPLFAAVDGNTSNATLKRKAGGGLYLQRGTDPEAQWIACEQHLAHTLPTLAAVNQPPTRQVRQPRLPAPRVTGDPDVDAILAAANIADAAQRQTLITTLQQMKNGTQAEKDAYAIYVAGANGNDNQVAAVRAAMRTSLNPNLAGTQRAFLADVRNTGPVAAAGNETGPTGPGTVNIPGTTGSPVGDNDQIAALGLNPIAKVIVEGKPEQARTDATNAIVDYMADETEKYIDDVVRNARPDPAARPGASLDAMKAVMRTAVQGYLQDPNKANGIGVLYTALISGKPAPAWIADDKKADVTSYLQLYSSARATLIRNMKWWTPQGGSAVDGCTMGGPWKGGTAGPNETSGQNTPPNAWAAAFLQCAINQSVPALMANHVTKAQVEAITNRLGALFVDPATLVVAPTQQASGVNLNFTAAGYSTQNLYRDGGIALDPFKVNVDGKNMDANIVLKITWRQAGTTMVPQVGIYDVSHDGSDGQPSHVFGSSFDFTKIPTGKDNAMDVRLQGNKKSYYDADKFGLKYTIYQDEEGIHFGVMGETAGEENSDMRVVSRDTLYNAAQSNIEQNGHTVDVNGHRFQALGQGGRSGQLLFFEVNNSQLVNKGQQLAPTLISDSVNDSVVDADGNNPPNDTTQTGPTQLGYIGYTASDPTKQQYYGLQWSAAKGYFEIKAMDAPPPAHTPNTSGTPPAGNSNNNNADQNNNNNGNANNNNGTTPPPGPGSNNNNQGTDPGTVGPGGRIIPANVDACMDGINWGTKKVLQASGKSWTYWINQGSSVECLWKNRFMAGDLLAEIELTGDEVAVTKVRLDGSFPEADRIPLTGNTVSADGSVTVAGRQARLSQISTCRIKLAGMGAAPDPADRNYTTTTYDKFCWIIEKQAPKGNTVRFPTSYQIFLDADAAGRINALVAKLAALNANLSSIFGQGASGAEANRTALKDYLTAAPGRLQLTGRVSATISVNVDDSTKHGAPIVTIQAADGGVKDTQRWCIPDGQLNPVGHLERKGQEDCTPRS